MKKIFLSIAVVIFTSSVSGQGGIITKPSSDGKSVEVITVYKDDENSVSEITINTNDGQSLKFEAGKAKVTEGEPYTGIVEAFGQLLVTSNTAYVNDKNAVVVENPDIFGSNNSVFRVDKIAVSPDETRLYVTLSVPNSSTRVKIPAATILRDPATGRSYRVRRTEGFPLDKFEVPRNKSASCVIIFDPIDPSIERIDYVEGYDSNNYFVSGIEVKKAELKIFTGRDYKYYPGLNVLVFRYNANISDMTSIPAEVLNDAAGKPMTVMFVKYL